MYEIIKFAVVLINLLTQCFLRVPATDESVSSRRCDGRGSDTFCGIRCSNYAQHRHHSCIDSDISGKEEQENSEHNPKKQYLAKTISGETEEHPSDFKIHTSIIQSFFRDNFNYDCFLDSICTLKTKKTRFPNKNTTINLLQRTI